MFIDNTKKIDIWIEYKHLWLNIGKKARQKFKKGDRKLIQSGMLQVKDIEKRENKPNDFKEFKLALFRVYVCCRKDQAPDDLKELDSQQFAKEVMGMILESTKEIKDIEINDVLCSVLDLRPSIGTNKEKTYHYYSAEYTPFVLLCGVILHG